MLGEDFKAVRGRRKALGGSLNAVGKRPKALGEDPEAAEGSLKAPRKTAEGPGDCR